MTNFWQYDTVIHSNSPTFRLNSITLTETSPSKDVLLWQRLVGASKMVFIMLWVSFIGRILDYAK
jgi:hypothetical protein